MTDEQPKKKKDPSAVRLGRRGGTARAASLTPVERTTIARDAAMRRWRAARAAKREEERKRKAQEREAKDSQPELPMAEGAQPPGQAAPTSDADKGAPS
jgi:hypothetical protein